MGNSSGNNWVPEIMYEEVSEGESSQIPFIMVPTEEVMPQLVYIFESRETGEFEPGLEGEEVPVVEWDLHQYADMAILKNNLDIDLYDKVRNAPGLENMISATTKGMQITQRVRETVEENN